MHIAVCWYYGIASTMPKWFKYDVIQLIRCIKERSCLWDKTLESNKDRIERRAAWEEVFTILEVRYNEMSYVEKKTTGKKSTLHDQDKIDKKLLEELIMNKWTNIRDAFLKSLKLRSVKPRRKYVLYDELQFLLKHVPEHNHNEEEAGYSSAEYTDDSTIFNMEHVSHEMIASEETSPVSYNTRKRSKIRDSCYKSSDVDFVEVVEGNDPRIMNEDEAFFASLLPSVVKYTEDERLEFRIEILALMRRIKNNRNNSL